MFTMQPGHTVKLFVRVYPHPTQGHVNVTWSDCLIGVCGCEQNHAIIAQMSDSQFVVMTEVEGQAMVASEQAFLAFHPSVMAHMELFQNADTAWDGVDLMEAALERLELMEELIEHFVDAVLLMAFYSLMYGNRENPTSTSGYPFEYSDDPFSMHRNMSPDQDFELWVLGHRC